MRTLRKIAFLLEEFARPSPAQQLLDRFLIGYPRDGAFHKPECGKVAAHLMLSGNEVDLGKRTEDYGLGVAGTAQEAVKDADAMVIVSRRPGSLANERFLHIAVEQAPIGAAIFVHGVLANTLERGHDLLQRARARQISVLAGTPQCVTWRLPEVDLPRDTGLVEALIVTQVNPLANQASPPAPPATLSGAELNALEGLLPVIERRRGGEPGIRSIRFVEGDALWRAGDKGLWSWPLLAAALSRSDSPQGDALADGRTQDLVGLGLVAKLARNPRGWLLEHRDGLRSALLVLDGVVADSNFAVRARDGGITSAQIYRAPPPVEQHYSKLAGAMEDFFRSGKPPWAAERNLLIAGLLETFRQPASRAARGILTPRLLTN